jgi:hypothetical protein
MPALHQWTFSGMVPDVARGFCRIRKAVLQDLYTAYVRPVRRQQTCSSSLMTYCPYNLNTFVYLYFYITLYFCAALVICCGRTV